LSRTREGRNNSRGDSEQSRKSLSTFTSCHCSSRLVSIVPEVPEDEDDPMDLLSPKKGRNHGMENSSDDSDRYEPENDIDDDNEDREMEEEVEGRGGRKKRPGRGDITAVRNTTTAFGTPSLSSGTAAKRRADLQGYVWSFFRCPIDLPFQWNSADEEDQTLGSLRAQPRLDEQEATSGYASSIRSSDAEDSLVQHGGVVGDDEDDELEASAAQSQTKGKVCNNSYDICPAPSHHSCIGCPEIRVANCSWSATCSEEGDDEGSPWWG
jgi:hypothetical protein